MKNAGLLAVFSLVLATVGGAAYVLQQLPDSQGDSGADRRGEEVPQADAPAAPSQSHLETPAGPSAAEPTGSAYAPGRAVVQPAPPSRTTTIAPRDAAVEQQMLSGHALSLWASALTGSAEFDQQLRRLHSASDASTLRRAQDYAALLSDHVAKGLKGVSLHDVACGDVVCMAALDVEPGATGWRGWTSALQGNGTLPMPALTSNRYTAPNGSTQLRMIFTTDPAYNAIMGGFAPPR